MTLVLRGATVIDGTGADPRPADITVHGERVDSVEPSATPAASGDVVDLDGLTVLPGLIDAHTHFGIVDLTGHHTPAAVTAARIFRNCELALDAGFTTVRDT